MASRQAPGLHASGLPWLHGTFGHSLERTKQFEEALGRQVDIVSVSPQRDGGWSSILGDTWWMERTPREGVILDVSVPLFPSDSSLDNGASGGDMANFEKLGALINSKYPGSAVRIGWEFNLKGWPWHATEENAEQWKKAFRNAATGLRKGGPSLLVQWNPNAGKGDSLADATKVYPGDDVVDIIALDSYDWWPAYTESTWPEHRDGQGGWAYWVKFARDHGKLFAVPEWGLAPGNSNGGGDNPYYMKVVSDFLWENRDIVFSVIYFDEPESYIRNSIAQGMVPQGTAAFKTALNGFAAQTKSSGTQAPAAAAPTSSAPTTATPTSAAPSPSENDTQLQAQAAAGEGDDGDNEATADQDSSGGQAAIRAPASATVPAPTSTRSSSSASSGSGGDSASDSARQWQGSTNDSNSHGPVPSSG